MVTSENPNTSATEMKKSFEEARARWETHRTMQQLSSLGGRVEYMTADVTDREQVLIQFALVVVSQLALQPLRILEGKIQNAFASSLPQIERFSIFEFLRRTEQPFEHAGRINFFG